MEDEVQITRQRSTCEGAAACDGEDITIIETSGADHEGL